MKVWPPELFCFEIACIYVYTHFASACNHGEESRPENWAWSRQPTMHMPAVNQG